MIPILIIQRLFWIYRLMRHAFSKSLVSGTVLHISIVKSSWKLINIIVKIRWLFIDSTVIRLEEIIAVLVLEKDWFMV